MKIYNKKANIYFIICLFLFLIFLIPTASADIWVSDSNIVSGLGDVGGYSVPTVYNDSGTWKLISGEQYGAFYGFDWNGSTWESNSSIVSGLGDVGGYSAPIVYNDSGTWKLISGETYGVLFGYQWNGSAWESNSSIVSGLGNTGDWSTRSPTVYNDGGTWKLISTHLSGVFSGFYWNGSTWISDSSIINGLSDIGSKSVPSVYNDGTWKLVVGAGDGAFFGFDWNGTGWESNSSIVSGLGNVGEHSAPTVYNDGTWKLISGEIGGVFHGFILNTSSTIPTLYTNLGNNLIDHTPTITWTKGTDVDGDTVTTYVYVGTTSTPTTLDSSTSGETVDLGVNTTLNDGTTYYYRLRSYDGYSYSDYTTSDEFRMNSLPIVSNVTLSPTPTRETDDLTAHNDTATDAESDSITLYYRWYKDNILQPALNDEITILASNLTLGDIWKVGIIPNDGYENGAEIQSATTTISEAPTIIDWSNNKTLDTSLDITINITESIEFNATADQSINTWNWFKDTVDAANNLYNYIVSWSTIGSKIVEVNVTNDNGTSNTILWNITVNILPPQNVQTTPHQTSVDIDWDDYASADNYSIYEMEDGFSYVNTNPTVDGIKDVIYDYAHEFLIFSPNPVNTCDYETIYPLRTSLGAYFLIESVDNDDKTGDDDCIYYFDLDNNGLTTNDYAWKITDNFVKKYYWDGVSWKVAGVTNAVGSSTGAGTHYPIHELFIPVAELGGNWTNGSTVKVLVKREDSSLTPDVITWYPYGNINDSDTSLWQEMVLNDPNTYNLLANVTLSNYTAIDLTPFTIYHGAVSTWNGTDESDYTLFNVITEDIPRYNASGYILNTGGDGISNATVYSCNGFVHEITTTNQSGYWIGYKFCNDTYIICANATNYNANSTSITIAGVDLTNVNITLSLSNYDNFTFTNAFLSPTVVRENSPFTVNVDINDTDGTITDAIVKISGNNYTMVNTIGDRWLYTFTETILPTEYYIQNFYAKDNNGAWNSTTSNLTIFALLSTGTGSTGGIAPVVVDEEEEIPLIPDIIDEEIEEIVGVVGNVSRVFEKILSNDDLLITGINSKIEKSLFTKEMYVDDTLACGFSSNLIKNCNVIDNVVTVDVLFNPDTSGLIYHEKTYLTFYNESVGRHTDFDIVIINLMFSIDFESKINNPSTLFFSSDNDKINGIRVWWIITMGLIGLIYLVWRNKRE